MRTLQELLEQAEADHGHLCSGQVLGVRMAMLGCQELGIEDPEGERRLIVFVEMDRCAADAIQTVTGCRLGRRTLRHVDYGKMAATFLDTVSGRAVRVSALPGRRERAAGLRPDASPGDAQIEAYRSLSDEELFSVQPVEVTLAPEDLPGPPVSRTVCERCGEEVSDRREVRVGDSVLCRACAHGPYYRPLDPRPARPP